ncbi:MAG: acyl carrier protein [Cellvibrio sp.]
MENQALYQLIQELIIEAAELNPIAIAPDDDLVAIGLDSLAGLEVTVNLEKKFKIKIPATRYEEMITIRAIADIVQDLVKQNESLPA